MHLAYPADTSRIITYYSFPNDPGMIYHNITVKKKKPQMVQLPTVVKDDSKSKAIEVCENIAITGGSVVAGYLVYRVCKIISSLFPPLW